MTETAIAKPWTIATRESRLALWQAEHVRNLLQSRFQRPVDLLGMTTQGDQILDRALSKVGGKGLFVKELEVALDEGRADLAALPQGAVVGTSSLRRMVQLRARRPDLKIEPLRGNLDTRLRKLDEGLYDAIVLAAAGLKRLGLAERIKALIDPQDMLPAAGQGALGLEIRQADTDLAERLASLAHHPTWLATLAERAVSRAMGGSCSMPLAAFGQWLDTAAGEAPTLQLQALLGHPTEPLLVSATLTGQPQTHAQAEAMGRDVALQLRAQAGPAWLAAL